MVITAPAPAGAPKGVLAAPRSPVRRRHPSAFRVLQHLLLLVVVLVSALPLVWILLTAIKPSTEIAQYPPTTLPGEITLENFESLFTVAGFAPYVTNSVVIAAVTTALTTLFGTFSAYAVSRFDFSVLKWIGELSLFAYMVPPILILVPVAQLVRSMGLTNSRTALIVLYTATLLPFAIWTLRSYFHGIAVDIEEAAMIDGCTRFGAFARVVVPQAVPGIIATGVFTFNAAWSEYLFASTLMSDPSKLTISPGLALLLDQTGSYSWGLLMAAAAVVVVPVLILFVVAQRFLVTGLGDGVGK